MLPRAAAWTGSSRRQAPALASRRREGCAALLAHGMHRNNRRRTTACNARDANVIGRPPTASRRVPYNYVRASIQASSNLGFSSLRVRTSLAGFRPPTLCMTLRARDGLLQAVCEEIQAGLTRENPSELACRIVKRCGLYVISLRHCPCTRPVRERWKASHSLPCHARCVPQAFRQVRGSWSCSGSTSGAVRAGFLSACLSST